MARKRVVHLGAAATMMFGLVASACGSSDNSTSGGSGTSSTAATCVSPGVTASEIDLGDLYAQSGPSAPSRVGWGDGIDAFVAMTNDAGGVNKRKIVVTHEDDQGTAQAQLDRTRDLVENKGVFALWMDPVGIGNNDYLSTAGIPGVALGQQDPTAQYNNLFMPIGWSALPGQGSSALADFLKGLGVTTVAVFTHNLASSIASGEVFAKASLADGLKVPYKRENVPTVPGDFTADVDQLKSNHVDGGYVGMVVPVEVALYKAAVQGGVNYKGFVFANLYDPNVVKQVGSVLDGAYTQLSHAPFESNLPEIQKFQAAMKKYAPNAVQGTNAFQGWLSAEFMVEQLKKLGACPTRSALINDFHTAKDWDGHGALAQKVQYKVPFLCIFFAKITGGSFQPANNAKPVCGHQVS